MASELTVTATRQQGMHYTVATRGHIVDSDYPLQEGDEGAGFTSLELLLGALTTCCGNTLGVVLGRMRKSCDGVEVTARAERRDEHPTVLTRIELDAVIRGADVDQATAERALAIAEERLCPVWAMLKPGTPIVATIRARQD